MKRATFAFLALAACDVPLSDPSHEILETSNGVVAKMVTLKTTPSIKSGSLSDAARDWQAFGWVKVNAQSCKETALPDSQNIEAYEIKTIGEQANNIASYNLRLCARQLTDPKRIAAIGYVVSIEKTK